MVERKPVNGGTPAGRLQVWKGSVFRQVDPFPYLLLLPTFVLLGFMLALPWLDNITNSFYAYKLNLPDAGRRFIGFANYAKLLQNPTLRTSLWTTVVYTSTAVALETALGFAIALLLNRNLRAGRVWQTLILFPMLLTPVAVGLMWEFMWNGTYGIINYLLSVIGIKGPYWLADQHWSLPALILTEVWQQTSYMVLMFLAGLAALPSEPYESAQLDGASPRQMLVYITVPLMRPVMAVAIMFRLMFTLRVFDVPFVLLGPSGGPGQNPLLSVLLYRTAFQSFDVGLSSALSVLLALLTMVVVYAVTRLIYREVQY